ncbi:methionyl-tRNA formyltransferase [Campylobacter peloridis]|uniref:Methionyl-tRNA formyltransferase n=1 Tax=Campylobacter peloridis TaxID=488546 RepID=A0A5C7DRK1_9BACT|nr:methionyl-tRNA formyltransferase [Campylobacter peloridis]TXE82845.1 methionyl-tRNA formyltransferase [Campylobacter peloridis]
MNIIIATYKEYDIKNLNNLKIIFPDFNFYIIKEKDKLNLAYIKNINPKYIFFPHWSYYIPKEIYENYECIVFHLGDLPFGRGGSPLQNLIIRGIYKSKISALKVCEVLDGGDIYLKHDISFKYFSAQKIYEKISKIIFSKLIPQILTLDIKPYKQKGKVVVFKRRKPNQSNVKTINNINIRKIYDFIRMLDAKDYPKAFLEYKNIKIYFKNAKLKNNIIQAKVEIYEK